MLKKSDSTWTYDNGRINAVFTGCPTGLRLEGLSMGGKKNWANSGTFSCSIATEQNQKTDLSNIDIAAQESVDSVTLTVSGTVSEDLRAEWNAVFYNDCAGIRFFGSLTNASAGILELGEMLPIEATLFYEPMAIYAYDGYGNMSDTGGLAAETDKMDGEAEFRGWVVLHDKRHDQSIMVLGDLCGYNSSNGGDTYWSARIGKQEQSLHITAGVRYDRNTPIPQGILLHPGCSHATTDAFIVLAEGGRDEVVNAMRRMIKKHVLLPLSETSPEASFNVWYTEANAEKYLTEDLEFASDMGFDAFTLDASWYDGGSVYPGTNDWAAGMGSYKENKEKFPNGMKAFSDKVHAKGMTFGLWVCPQNIDCARERSGEIPESYLAKINGEALHCDVQPLSLTTQLCMGNPEVEDWLFGEISRCVEQWHVDWIKWDPSATVSFCCNRSDHGHTAKDGVVANVEARYRIMRRLVDKYPRLRGWECIYDMRVARTNPVGCSNALFPEYTNIFMTGPTVGPHVWGCYEYASGMFEPHMAMPARPFFEISYLDYFIRGKLSQGGFSLGNITGMLSQRLSNAPNGFNDSLKRNIMQFKQYRHMFREDIYRMGLLDDENGWHAVEYAATDMSKVVAFVFRDGSDNGDNKLAFKALDPNAVYEVTSQNERPGKEKNYTGKQLMADGLQIHLPHPALASGNYNLDRLPPSFRDEFAGQLLFGSDVLVAVKTV